MSPADSDAQRPQQVGQPACMLWIGPADGAEFGPARSWLAGRTACRGSDLLVFDSPRTALESAVECGPELAVLATDRPGRWSLRDAVGLSLRWPLMPIVAVTSSLVDGRRRSGPPLPGIEEVFWHDLPGRCERWLADLDAGRHGSLGLPATTRREERLLESLRREPGAGIRGSTAGSVTAARSVGRGSTAVAVVAEHALDLEGLADLLTLAGRRILPRRAARPALDESAELLVWDVGRIRQSHLAWLGMLSANRPSLRIVLLDSFPRSDSSLAAMRAGADAVLGRPVLLETLEGTLLRLERG